MVKRYLKSGSLTLALVLSACAHAAPVASVRPAAVAAAAAVTVTPEDALAKATKKALAWQPDARPVATAWVVVKSELSSAVYHLFQSPKADKLYLVQTKLTSFWQDGYEVSDAYFCKPARYMATLGPTHTTAEQALAAAKAYLPAPDQHPLALLIAAKPVAAAPALWAVKVDTVQCLINADNGQVLVHGGGGSQLPPLPFVLPNGL